jgi:hypothetical protein
MKLKKMIALFAMLMFTTTVCFADAGSLEYLGKGTSTDSSLYLYRDSVNVSENRIDFVVVLLKQTSPGPDPAYMALKVYMRCGQKVAHITGAFLSTGKKTISQDVDTKSDFSIESPFGKIYNRYCGII